MPQSYCVDQSLRGKIKAAVMHVKQSRAAFKLLNFALSGLVEDTFEQKWTRLLYTEDKMNRLTSENPAVIQTIKSRLGLIMTDLPAFLWNDLAFVILIERFTGTVFFMLLKSECAKDSITVHLYVRFYALRLSSWCIQQSHDNLCSKISA